MERPAEPTIVPSTFETTDPEVANAALAHMYGDVRSRVFGDAEQFTYQLRSAASANLAAAHMRFTMGFGISADLTKSHHTLLVMLSGDHYQVSSQYGGTTLRAGDIAVVPAGAALEVSLEALDVITVSLAAEDLNRAARETFGIAPDDFAITDMEPISGPSTRYFRRLLSLASSELLSDVSAMNHPLLHQETVHSLCAAFLHAIPTTATSTDASRTGNMAPRALRRAVEFIDAHAADPITLSDIAAAAGISPRAVQHAFSRHRETTPMAYLRHVRLANTHRELQAADPTAGDTVAVIAQRWGFAKPGRFAALYREAFGVNPRQTLRS